MVAVVRLVLPMGAVEASVAWTTLDGRRRGMVNHLLGAVEENLLTYLAPLPKEYRRRCTHDEGFLCAGGSSQRALGRWA